MLTRDGNELAAAVGRALRHARRANGLTLRTAAERSGGSFKASALGAYERGERRISLERFSVLASLYNVAPDRLLSEALALVDPAGRRSVVIDLSRLTSVPAPEREYLAEFVHQVRDRRRDLLTDVITLRSGDVHAMALSVGLGSDELLARLRPAVRANGRDRSAV